MKRWHKHARRSALAVLIAAPMAVGCGTGSSFRAPFAGRSAAFSPLGSKNGDETGRIASAAGTQPGGTDVTLASSTDSPPSMLASFNRNAKNAWTKTTGVFRRSDPAVAVAETDQQDPLSLSANPGKLEPKVYVANGQLLESTGKFEKAIESYNRALAIDPNHTDALTNLGRLNFQQKNYSQAAELFQKALATSPNDAELYNQLGLTLHRLERNDIATTVLQRALTLSPGTSRYANNLASVMHATGNVGGAYEVLVKNNKPAVAHFNMAYLHFTAGNMAEARKQVNESLKFDGRSGGDVVVSRAVARSKDMLAQIDALQPSATPNPALPGSALPGSTLPGSGASGVLVAGGGSAVTTGPTAATGPIARVASTSPSISLPGGTQTPRSTAKGPSTPHKPAVSFGGWPGTPTPPTPRQTKRIAPTKPSVPGATSVPGAISIPATTGVPAATSIPAAGSRTKDTSAETGSKSEFKLPQL